MRSIRVLLIGISTAALLAVTTIGVVAREDPTSRPPIPSAGCETSEIEAGQHPGSMRVDDTHRSWVLHVPPAHDGRSPVPLVVLMHGIYETPTEIELETGFGHLGAQLGLAVVAPSALEGNWMQDFSEVFIDATPSNPDVVFVEALLDRLGEELCLDLARIYATGFSNGGMATSVLACALEDRIAAAAPVAGLADFGAGCVQDRPVPLLAFHGTNDQGGLYEGGFGAPLLALDVDGVPWAELPLMDDPGYFTSIPDRAAGFAERNGCEPGPSSEFIADGVEMLSWECPEGAEVALVAAHGDGHSWPGSAYIAEGGEFFETTMEIDATEMIWEFFEQHAMPE